MSAEAALEVVAVEVFDVVMTAVVVDDFLVLMVDVLDFFVVVVICATLFLLAAEVHLTGYAAEQKT